MTRGSAEGTLIDAILDSESAPSTSVLGVGHELLQYVVATYRRTGSPPRPVIDALCTLSGSDQGVARDRANALIFTHLVEGLSDAFEPDLPALYDAVFSQIIDRQRQNPEGRRLDEALKEFGLATEDDMRTRRSRLRNRDTPPVPAGRIRKAIVLSRVTIGADVAITSVILGKLRRQYPLAEIALLAPARTAELFSGDPRIQVVPTSYPRHGSLVDRISTWLGVRDRVEGQVTGFANDELLYVDPDSRLTQLGLFPLTRNESAYRIFESRSAGAGGDACFGELAAAWAGLTFGNSETPPWPYLSLGAAQLELGRDGVAGLRQETTRKIVSISFGVGGNPNKRADQTFETDLITELVRDGHMVLLDRGIGDDRTWNDRVSDALRTAGVRLKHANEDNLRDLAARRHEAADVVTWTGGVGLFSALISASDLYIGYDSAFQHVAAALEVPVLAVVLGYPGPRFRSRWRPYSKKAVTVLPETGSSRPPEFQELSRTVLASARSVLRS